MLGAGAAAGCVPVALASSGPFVFTVLSGLDAVVKVGTGFGPSTRGKVYTTRSGLLKRLVVEGGSALFSLDHAASLWLGVVGNLLLVRDGSMKAGVVIAYTVDTLADAGVLNQGVTRGDGESNSKKGAGTCQWGQPPCAIGGVKRSSLRKRAS